VAISFAMVSSSIGMSTYLSHDGFSSLVLLYQNIGVFVVFFLTWLFLLLFLLIERISGP
jgi:hypothetical protein